MGKKVVIASACRTAIGTMGGSLSNTPAVVRTERCSSGSYQGWSSK